MNLLEMNKIGLDQETSQKTAEKLNELLANFQIFYMNVRGLHWNIRGREFFVLHEKFEELYNDALQKIDVLAERILALGFTPEHAYSTYIEVAELEEVENVNASNDAMQVVLQGLKKLLVIERAILNHTSETDDEGTNALMSDYIGQYENLVWMYSSALEQ